jgi:hypothetical protein
MIMFVSFALVGSKFQPNKADQGSSTVSSDRYSPPVFHEFEHPSVTVTRYPICSFVIGIHRTDSIPELQTTLLYSGRQSLSFGPPVSGCSRLCPESQCQKTYDTFARLYHHIRPRRHRLLYFMPRVLG